ncbi:MAG TPA: hypothetical protein VIK86_04130 [Candidatus Paceibacterota bacterium]
MKIGIGSTRIVLIFSFLVIKFPRMRFLRLFTRTVEANKNGSLKRKSELYSKKNVFVAVARYLLEGVMANRKEYFYFQKNKNKEELLPVRLLFFGIIEIQDRGNVLAEDSFLWKRMYVLLRRKNLHTISSFKASNFCIFQEKLKILDYADEQTINALEIDGFKIIAQLNYR